MSIVDKDRLWFKAMAGMPRFEHPRNLSFCGWTLLPHAPEVLVVEDTREDRRCAFARHYLDVGMQELAAVASDEAWSGSNAACAAVPAISWVKLVSDFALLVIVGGISCVCIVA